jgi:hypothetical protein
MKHQDSSQRLNFWWWPALLGRVSFLDHSWPLIGIVLLYLSTFLPIFFQLFLIPSRNNTQSSWLQIQRQGFDSRRYQIFWEVVSLERGPLNPVSTIEELLERKSSGSGLESREYGRRDPSRWPRGTLYSQTLALTSPTSGGHSVRIVRSRTQTMEFSLVLVRNNTNIYFRMAFLGHICRN